MNDYGQLSHKSGLAQALDELLERYTFQAYGAYKSNADDEMAMEQKKGKKNYDPQHQLNTDGITILEPAVYAEKQAFERQEWRRLKRQYDRLFDLGEGLCLKCREKNDQPRRRFCSKCEENVS